jgi:hypothetical protein
MASEARSNSARFVASALLIALFTAAIGYVLASGVVQWWLGQAEPDFALIVKNWQLLQQYEPRLLRHDPYRPDVWSEQGICRGAPWPA